MQAVVLLTLAAARNNAMSIRTPRTLPAFVSIPIALPTGII